MMKPRPISKLEQELIEIKQLWRDVAVAVARAENTKDSNVPTKYANAAVYGYLDFLKEIETARLLK